MFPDVDWDKNPSLLFSDAPTETGGESSLDFKGMFDESVHAQGHAPPSTTAGTSVNTNVGITTHGVKCRKLFHFLDDDDFIQETQLVSNPATAVTQILVLQDTILETQIAADTHIPETLIGAKIILELQDKVPETQISDPQIPEWPDTIPKTQIDQYPTTADTGILQTQVPEVHHSTDLVRMPMDDDDAETTSVVPGTPEFMDESELFNLCQDISQYKEHQVEMRLQRKMEAELRNQVHNNFFGR